MKYALTILFTTALCTWGTAQEENIDASKPTNFYTLLDNTLEVSNRPNETVSGYRGKLMFAPSEAHLILAELPLLYNSRTEKFGLGDVRARYFWLPYKNYDSFFGAFGPSIDVFMPTGSFENGLGSDRWLLSPGITIGLMASEKIQFFPIVSYQYGSAPVSEIGESAGLKETHGITVQCITPIVFSDKFFVQITPIFRMNEINNERSDRYVQEFFAAYSIQEKLQLTGFYSGNFTDEIHTVSIGLTSFL